MYLDEIEIIKAVSESKSLSQAADKLHISRPNLSQKIAALERDLNANLYDRTPQGVTPTRQGFMLTEFAKRVSDMTDELRVELASLSESFTPDIEVGASLADGVTLLPPLFKKYHDEHPEVTIHLDCGYEPELIKKLTHYALDFALLEDRSMESGMHWDKLGDEELIIAAPNRPPFSLLHQPVKYEKLLPLPMVIYEWNSGRHMVGNRHFRVNNHSSLNDNNIVARMDTHEPMIEAVRAGLGWGSFPRCIWERYKNESQLIRINVDTPPILYDVSLVAVEGRPMSPVAKDFYKYVKKNVPTDYFYAGGKTR